MDVTDDARIVEQVLAGDQSAYAALVTRYQDTVYSVAYRLCANHSDAADMAQDAFITAFRKLHQYKHEYTFGQWVIGICSNRTRNLFRSRWRRQQTEQRHYEDACEDPLVTHRSEQQNEEVAAALAQLPVKFRLAVTLRHIEDYSYEDIARMLRIGISAVKMRVKRGLVAMEQILKEERKETP
ncbi:MAG TPA: hypothetical protein DCS43_15545 [Verrucomicrobia bacterium]|nr:hypothetical protein [Verrucomicrobiota bacterium]